MSAALRRAKRRQHRTDGTYDARQEATRQAALTRIEPLTREGAERHLLRRSKIASLFENGQLDFLQGPLPKADDVVENRLQLLMDIYNTTASPLLGFDPSTHPWLYNKLAQCALTVDCLIRLAVDPLSAEVLRHPALELMPPIPESAATFQMYVRVHPTTLGEATTAMETLRTQRMNHSPRLIVMLDELAERRQDEEDQLVEVYGGVTFRDVETRLEEDQVEGRALFRRRLALEPKPNFRSLRFKELCIVVEDASDGDGDLTSLWHAHPELWDLEVLLIGCLGQASWNSAYGGATVLRFEIPPSDGSMLQHVVQHFNVKTIAVPTTTEVMIQLDRIQSAIKGHFQEQLHFYRLRGQGAVSERAAERAAEYAGAICPAHLDANNTLSIRMAMDITLRDAKGLSTFWGVDAGNGPRRYRDAIDRVSGFEPSTGVDDLAIIAQRYGPFADFWNLCLLHQLIQVAIICMIKLLWLVRPLVILVQSDKMSTLLSETRFLARDTQELQDFLDSTISLEAYVSSTGALAVRQTEEKPEEEDNEVLKAESSSKAAEREDCEEGEEDRSDSESEDLLWEEFARGNFISEKASSYAAKLVGPQANRSLHRLANPSWPTYKPIFQSRVHRLGLCVAMKNRVALSMAAELRPEPTEPSMQEFRRAVEATCDSLNLNATIRQVRSELGDILQGLECLANLPSVPRSPEANLELFDKHSAIMKGIRANTLHNSTTAQGEPHGTERAAQISSLVEQHQSLVSNNRPSRIPVPKYREGCREVGDDGWRTWLSSLPRGIVLAESARSSGNSSQAVQSALTRARLRLTANRLSRRDASVFPDPGISLLDLIKLLSKPPAGTQSLQEEYRLIECQACDELDKDTLGNMTHVCSAQASQSFIRYRASTHSMTILYYPVQLLLNEKYGYAAHMEILADRENWHLSRFVDEEGASLLDAVQHKCYGDVNNEWMAQQAEIAAILRIQFSRGREIGVKRKDDFYGKMWKVYQSM
ncbi:hypothetical protein NliqN6_3928 [Naganishia liquefaciens]|uniref:Uncharacterized protein n=1 Tax=Naganishia liquefaciens TaxID=104408 RepID=A0A8H3TU10_9TREE|nr:hypothetical protein NliqN6_3928 [Naganishia liquefaciens]